MGSCGRRFRRAFFIKSTVFKRNRRISRTVLSFDGYRSVNELSVNSKRRRKQENVCTQTEALNVQHIFWSVSLPSLKD